MKDSIIACLKGPKAWRRCYVNVVLGNAFFLGFCLLFDIASTRSLVTSLALTLHPTHDGSKDHHAPATLTSCLTVVCVFASMAYISQKKIKTKDSQMLEQGLTTHIPDHGRHIPDHGRHIPDNGRHIPDNGRHIPVNGRHTTGPPDVCGELAMYEKNNHAVTDDRLRPRGKLTDDLCLFLSRDQEIHDKSKVHDINRTEHIQNDSITNVLDTEPRQQNNNSIKGSTIDENTAADPSEVIEGSVPREVSQPDIKELKLTAPMQAPTSPPRDTVTLTTLTFTTRDQASQTDVEEVEEEEEGEGTLGAPKAPRPEAAPTYEVNSEAPHDEYCEAATMTDQVPMDDEETETEEESDIELVDASSITSGPFMKKLRRAQRTLQDVKVNTARERKVKVKPWREVLGRYRDKMSGLHTLLRHKDQLAGVTCSARMASQAEVKGLQAALMSSKDKLENQLKINRKLEADIEEKSCASVVAPDNSGCP